MFILAHLHERIAALNKSVCQVRDKQRTHRFYDGCSAYHAME
jgi:hypothetical protein